MTKQVILSLSGLQFGSDADIPVEVIAPGEYFFEDGKHNVVYEEMQEGFSEITQNTISIGKDIMDITKKGLVNVHMVFEKNKKNMTYYETPYGSILIGIVAKNIDVKETEEEIHIKVEYALEMNYEYVSDCSITMNIKSKDAKNFTLQ